MTLVRKDLSSRSGGDCSLKTITTSKVSLVATAVVVASGAITGISIPSPSTTAAEVEVVIVVLVVVLLLFQQRSERHHHGLLVINRPPFSLI